MTATTIMTPALTAIMNGSSLVAWKGDGFDEYAGTFDAYDPNRRTGCNKLAGRQHGDPATVGRRDPGRAQKGCRTAGFPGERRQIGGSDVLGTLRGTQREPARPGIFRQTFE